ncbi:MAG: glycosyltransferase family 2 protein, partial [Anaerolineales bacterium]|nr:glycosyltransferase family 2 protein [Anaerolineales bacterium]
DDPASLRSTPIGHWLFGVKSPGTHLELQVIWIEWMVDYSIVIPVYFNEGTLKTTFEALSKEVIGQNPELTCKIIFVDDGSEDGSLDELLELRASFPDLITVVKLTRNFGQVSAVMAGLSLAPGKCTIILSADNQDPAGLINQMLKAYFEETYDIVICTRKGRDESFFRIITSRIFYSIMRWLGFPSMPSGGFDYMLLSHRAAKTICRNSGATAFFQGQVLWTGYKTKFIEYQRREREIGKSRWTFGKKFTYFLDGIAGYSFLPIRFMSVLGMAMAFLGFLYAATIFFAKLIWGLPVEGWAPLMIVILIIGGLQMLMLGIIGEYLWRVLAEVRNREQFIIDAIYDELSTIPRQ